MIRIIFKLTSGMLLCIFLLIGCLDESNDNLKLIELNSELDIQEYIELVENEKSLGRIPILYFSAEWCPPCKPINKILTENQYCTTKLKGITIIKVDLPNEETQKTKLLDKLKNNKTKFIPCFKIIDANGEPGRNIPIKLTNASNSSIDSFYNQIVSNHNIHRNSINLEHYFLFELELLDSAQFDWVEVSSDYGKIRINESELKGTKLIQKKCPIIGEDYLTILTKRKGQEAEYNHMNKVNENDVFRYRLHGVGYTVRIKPAKW